MIWALVIGTLLAITGVYVTYISVKKDAVKQGLYGHLSFYLYLLADASLIIAVVSGLNNVLWPVLIFITLGWLFIGRILTFLRLFKELTYLHLAAGIITVIWILTLVAIEFII
ncbi:MAG: hypothetical protein E3J54_01015 [Actinobacteria bacterium]|nr:MAG: hypothetical protein E3J54_01015 [Actinomycetota bacterium]